MAHYHTGLSFLRASTFDRSQNAGLIPLALRSFHEDKNFTAPIARVRPKLAGAMLHQLLMRTPGEEFMTPGDAVYIAKASVTPVDATPPFTKYRSTKVQNKTIDRALTLLNKTDKFIGEGAASTMTIPKNLVSEEHSLRETPIAIIGYGAAGILIYSALRRLGFRNVRAFEKAVPNGIWAKPNVNGGTKNNPRELTFSEIASLKIANGDGSKDGRQVTDFLENVRSNFSESFAKKEVKTVYPSYTAGGTHRITFTDGSEENFPIIINCIGMGSPRELNDHNRMTVHSQSDKFIATRWQSVNLSRTDALGHSFIFIGLGNSTAEMVAQMYDLIDAGTNVDFKILTHLPRDAVYNPSETVAGKDRKTFRVFRDLSTPDLTGFQGDLRRGRSDYYRALNEGRIISDVKQWGMKGSSITYSRPKGGKDSERCSKLFALCGYQHDYTTLSQFSIPLDDSGIYPNFDYDGEFRDNRHIIKGYFGFGALTDVPHARNNVVIPGMMYRLPDMLYSIIYRAEEYQITQGEGL